MHNEDMGEPLSGWLPLAAALLGAAAAFCGGLLVEHRRGTKAARTAAALIYDELLNARLILTGFRSYGRWQAGRLRASVWDAQQYALILAAPQAAARAARDAYFGLSQAEWLGETRAGRKALAADDSELIDRILETVRIAIIETGVFAGLGSKEELEERITTVDQRPDLQEHLRSLGLDVAADNEESGEESTAPT